MKKKYILLILICLILLITIIFINKNVYVGKIVDGKIEYIDKIVNVTKYDNNTIIEFKNDYEYIDNCIITTSIYNKLKNNDSVYNLSLKDYSKLNDISNKESYNINRALQEKIVKEDDVYHEYLAKTCGFKNKKVLIKYIDEVNKLLDKNS